jgi:hypothetical protein
MVLGTFPEETVAVVCVSAQLVTRLLEGSLAWLCPSSKPWHQSWPQGALGPSWCFQTQERQANGQRR